MADPFTCSRGRSRGRTTEPSHPGAIPQAGPCLGNTSRTWDRKTTKPVGRHGILYGDKVISVKNGVRQDIWPKDNGQGYVANGEIGIVVGQYKGKSWPFGKKVPWKLEVEFSSQKGAKVRLQLVGVRR